MGYNTTERLVVDALAKEQNIKPKNECILSHVWGADRKALVPPQ